MSMHPVHFVNRLIGVSILLMSVSLTFGSLPAQATTGPSHFLPPSPYHVGSKLEQLYRGQYVLAQAARSARLSGGALGIEVNENGQLHGVGQFYTYDEHGYATTWVATLYNFRPAAKGIMIIDLLGQGGRPLLGRLFVTRSSHGDLSGQIELGKDRYSISWRKITDL